MISTTVALILCLPVLVALGAACWIDKLRRRLADEHTRHTSLLNWIDSLRRRLANEHATHTSLLNQVALLGKENDKLKADAGRHAGLRNLIRGMNGTEMADLVSWRTRKCELEQQVLDLYTHISLYQSGELSIPVKDLLQPLHLVGGSRQDVMELLVHRLAERDKLLTESFQNTECAAGWRRTAEKCEEEKQELMREIKRLVEHATALEKNLAAAADWDRGKFTALAKAEQELEVLRQALNGEKLYSGRMKLQFDGSQEVHRDLLRKIQRFDRAILDALGLPWDTDEAEVIREINRLVKDVQGLTDEEEAPESGIVASAIPPTPKTYRCPGAAGCGIEQCSHFNEHDHVGAPIGNWGCEHAAGPCEEVES
jgi:hypothetical protein